ncbi:SseB family protein [Mucilaginibacter sp. RS28]|uniref:SseB family protein n=1 Tax=Mucilaginibacter straminoryzae TaxID=2932774 RepID=A0A9X1X5I8_9SPHI|nr:SseB family protein [Mucilaginibacter straminoryzae]MCJ8210445.1 SseB family protein [Mucilaginibacter straminoryzae]
MNLLKKLTNASSMQAPPSTEPDNSHLCRLLNIWSVQQSEQAYKDVLDEILKGNGFLLLPSINEEKTSTNWQTTAEETTLKLTSVFEINGRKVLGAFSDEPAMVKWAKNPTDYTAMPTRELLEFCQVNEIDRVVINSGEENMFLIERSR